MRASLNAVDILTLSDSSASADESAADVVIAPRANRRRMEDTRRAKTWRGNTTKAPVRSAADLSHSAPLASRAPRQRGTVPVTDANRTAGVSKAGRRAGESHDGDARAGRHHAEPGDAGKSLQPHAAADTGRLRAGYHPRPAVNPAQPLSQRPPSHQPKTMTTPHGQALALTASIPPEVPMTSGAALALMPATAATGTRPLRVSPWTKAEDRAILQLWQEHRGRPDPSAFIGLVPTLGVRTVEELQGRLAELLSLMALARTQPK